MRNNILKALILISFFFGGLHYANNPIQCDSKAQANYVQQHLAKRIANRTFIKSDIATAKQQSLKYCYNPLDLV